MPYLKFLVKRVFPYYKESIQQFVNICVLCMGLKTPEIKLTDKNKFVLYDAEEGMNIDITQKEFEDIKKKQKEILLLKKYPKQKNQWIDCTENGDNNKKSQ